MKLCESKSIIKIEIVNDCENTSQQYARYKISTRAFLAIIDNSKIIKSKQMRKIKTFDDSKDIFT